MRGKVGPHFNPVDDARRVMVEGRLLSDVPGALWTVDGLEACRVSISGVSALTSVRVERSRDTSRAARASLDFARDERGGGGPPAPTSLDFARDERGGGAPTHPRFTRIAIGVDPPSGGGTCGIVVCAVDGDGVGHVLADHCVTAASPERWARAVADAAALYGKSGTPVLNVAEVNEGGRTVESVLRAAGPGLRLKLVRASEGKAARAEPVALLFEAQRVRVHGRMAALEPTCAG